MFEGTEINSKLTENRKRVMILKTRKEKIIDLLNSTYVEEEKDTDIGDHLNFEG